MVQAIDMMPPGVSTMTHIWDMHGMRMLLNLNPNAVLQLLSVLEGYFAERMHELIIVDVPQVAQFLVEAIWPAVPERTRKKVFFLSAKDALLHLKESCAPALTAQIGALVERNRDPACSLEERRNDWKQAHEEACEPRPLHAPTQLQLVVVPSCALGRLTAGVCCPLECLESMVPSSSSVAGMLLSIAVVYVLPFPPLHGV
eukprot:UN3371